MIDTYKTIASTSIGEFKDRGSKFIAYTSPLLPHSVRGDNLEGDFSLFLEKIKKEHPKARHYCFAWRMGLDGNSFRANDDGEPSGTAGRPILGQIDSFGLTNVGVVVVRYFGGTLLGTSGLIAAYKESTAAAFRQADIIVKTIEDIFEIRFEYDKMPDVMNALKRLSINVLSQKFDENGVINISIRQSESEQSILNLRALILKKSIVETQKQEDTDERVSRHEAPHQGVQILKILN